jgi:hypothetical protein
MTGYVALCLTGGVGVAVLGARRPGAAAWNFVVLGLLAVEMLSLFEGLNQFRTSPLRIVFLSITLAIAVGNYLPTRLAGAAVVGGLAVLPDLLMVAGPTKWTSELMMAAHCGRGALALVPWLARFSVGKRAGGSSELDQMWRSFRDRYGFLWAQRLREQFNRSAANAGWPVRLTWTGLRSAVGQPADDTFQDEARRTLQALLRRFDVLKKRGQDF